MRPTALLATALTALALTASPAAAQEDDDVVDVDTITINLHDVITDLANGLGACVIVGGCDDPGA